MKEVKIIPTELSGQIVIPPSKSLSHRSIISACLSNEASRVSNLIFSDDIKATINAMKVIRDKNIEIKEVKQKLFEIFIKSNENEVGSKNIIDCNESGSTLRFLVPLVAMQNRPITLIGKGKLVSRPLDDYYRILDEQKIMYKNNHGKLPLTIDGKLKSGTFELSGNVSSQFITGLLIVLPLLDGDSQINITTPLESKGYVDLTIDMLKKSKIEIENDSYRTFKVKGNQKYKQIDYCVEGDYSQAAFWICAGLMCSNITCKGLDNSSKQGDKVILEIVKAMGGRLDFINDCVHVYQSELHGIDIDVSQCPDLAPILTALAAVSNKTTRILNAKRLRIKESDRLNAIATEINKLGGDVTELEDSLIIHGKKMLEGGIVDSHNDHRIAMALAIVSVKCNNEVTIMNADAVNKSYPTFWEDFKKLGGRINEC